MRREYRPKELERCSGCNRLVRKVIARDGPEGGRFGPGCYDKAVQATLIDPFAQVRTSVNTEPDVDPEEGTNPLEAHGECTEDNSHS